LRQGLFGLRALVALAPVSGASGAVAPSVAGKAVRYSSSPAANRGLRTEPNLARPPRRQALSI